jgi:predicted metal-binding protein
MCFVMVHSTTHLAHAQHTSPLTCVHCPGCRLPLRGEALNMPASSTKARSFSSCVSGRLDSTQFSSST